MGHGHNNGTYGDESESAATLSFTVLDDDGIFDGSELLESSAEGVIGRGPGEASNEQFHGHFGSVSFLGWRQGSREHERTRGLGFRSRAGQGEGGGREREREEPGVRGEATNTKSKPKNDRKKGAQGTRSRAHSEYTASTGVSSHQGEKQRQTEIRNERMEDDIFFLTRGGRRLLSREKSGNKKLGKLLLTETDRNFQGAFSGGLDHVPPTAPVPGWKYIFLLLAIVTTTISTTNITTITPIHLLPLVVHLFFQREPVAATFRATRENPRLEIRRGEKDTLGLRVRWRIRGFAIAVHSWGYPRSLFRWAF